MTPQKKQAVMFLALMIVISLGIAAWVFFVNFGYLEVNGKPPFTVNVSSIKNEKCENPPCKYKIKSGEHMLTAKKIGYFDSAQKIEIKRWKTNLIEIPFSFIPVVKSLDGYNLPASVSRFGSNAKEFDPGFDWSKIELSKIPKASKYVNFSPGAQRALVYLGKETYLFDQSADEAILTAISVPSAEIAEWIDDNRFIVLTKPKENELQKLMVFDAAKPDAPALITSFERYISSPNLLVFNNSSILTDLDDGNRIYFIDYEKKSKNRMEFEEGAGNFHKINDFLFSYEADGKFFLKDIFSGKSLKIPALSSSLILGLDKNRVLFASGQSFNQTGASNVSIEEFVKMAEKGIEQVKKTNEKNGTKTLYFIGMDSGSGEKHELASIEIMENEMISFWKRVTDANKIYFLKNPLRGPSSKLFMLQMSE